ncbi:MAG: hypothetical protein HXM33_04080, partial [Haemophilus sp.]|nr:hypothetical protein [Haemophilus sp.]
AANLVGISFALENGEAAYLPLQLDYLGAPKTLEKTTALFDEYLKTSKCG